MLIIRQAVPEDLSRIAEIYEKIHSQEEAGLASIGWQRNVYPTEKTARASIEKGDMFVAVAEGLVVASAKINQEQVAEYINAFWEYEAEESRVMVLHTLTVDPDQSGKGYARAFLSFYEKYAKDHECPFLRMDTNEKNTKARAMYRKFGYKEVGIVDSYFNGIAGVRLVCLEKAL